jgi:hypothetical protein
VVGSFIYWFSALESSEIDGEEREIEGKGEDVANDVRKERKGVKGVTWVKKERIWYVYYVRG